MDLCLCSASDSANDPEPVKAIPSFSINMGRSGSKRLSPQIDSHRLKTDVGREIANLAQRRADIVVNAERRDDESVRCQDADQMLGDVLDILARLVFGVRLGALEVSVVDNDDVRLAGSRHAIFILVVPSGIAIAGSVAIAESASLAVNATSRRSPSAFATRAASSAGVGAAPKTARTDVTRHPARPQGTISPNASRSGSRFNANPWTVIR